MIVLSGALVLVATALLVIGLAGQGLTLVYASIATSVLAGVLLVVGTLRGGREPEAEQAESVAGQQDSGRPQDPVAEPEPAASGVRVVAAGEPAPSATQGGPVGLSKQPSDAAGRTGQDDGARLMADPAGPADPVPAVAAEQDGTRVHEAPVARDVTPPGGEQDVDADPPVEDDGELLSDVDEAELEEIDTTVLVVSGRPRYHLAGCRYLQGKQADPVDVLDARDEGFTPCGVCKPDAVLVADLESQPVVAAPAVSRDRMVLEPVAVRDDPARPDAVRVEDLDEQALRDASVAGGTHEGSVALGAEPLVGERGVAGQASSGQAAGEGAVDEPLVEAPPVDEALPDPAADDVGPATGSSGLPTGQPAPAAPSRARGAFSRFASVASVAASKAAVAAARAVAPSAPTPAAPMTGADRADEPAAPQAPSGPVPPDAGRPSGEDDQPTTSGAADGEALPVAEAPAVSMHEAGRGAPETAPVGQAAPAPDALPVIAVSGAGDADVTGGDARSSGDPLPVQVVTGEVLPARDAAGEDEAVAAEHAAPQALPAGEVLPVLEPGAGALPAGPADEALGSAVSGPLGAAVPDDTGDRAAAGTPAPGVATRPPRSSRGGKVTPRSAASAAATTPARRGTVVLIPDRGKFHRPECRYVRDATGTIELGKLKATRQGYTACGVCRP